MNSKKGRRRILHKEAVDIIKRYLKKEYNASIDIPKKKPKDDIPLPDIIVYDRSKRKHYLCEVETRQAQLERAVQKFEACQVYRDEIYQASLYVAITRDLFEKMSDTEDWQEFFDKMKVKGIGIFVVYATTVKTKLAAKTFAGQSVGFWESLLIEFGFKN